MYDRRLQDSDEDLTFSVSGMLWERSVVMKDQATGSLWSLLLGRAMQGELSQQSLRARPSILTDWKSWKEEHPLTTVTALPPMSRFYDSSCYAGRFGQYLIGIRNPDSRPKAWRFDQLTFKPVLNDVYAGEPILITFHEKTGTATIFNRRLNEEVLEFEVHADGFTDKQTKSTWDGLTGTALSGPLKGQQLTQQISIPSFSEAWGLFHNDSEYWGVPLPQFFSNQTIENISIKCEEASKKHLIELYRLRIKNEKNSPSTQKPPNQSNEFIGRER